MKALLVAISVLVLSVCNMKDATFKTTQIWLTLSVAFYVGALIHGRIFELSFGQTTLFSHSNTLVKVSMATAIVVFIIGVLHLAYATINSTRAN